jgi:GT2 family glycosyltransferase
MLINISIVLYKNTQIQLKKIISNCLNSIDLINNIYLLDNSPDNYLSKQLTKNKKIVYLFSNKNLGYGKAHNIAIKQSFAKNIKYHLVLNPDIFFKKGTLEKIINYMNNNPDIGLLMPRIHYPDGSIQYLCKLLPTPFNLIFRRFLPIRKYRKKKNNLFELRFAGYDKIMEVPYLSGCFMFFRTEALKDTGLFDENIFMYGEDTDITRRIYKKYKTIYYPLAEATHEFHKESYKNIRMMVIHIRSIIYYFNKWGWFFDNERRTINKEVLKKISTNL